MLNELHAHGDVIVDKYRLERKIGEGAMGEVWLATHLALGQPVAVKVIHPHLRKYDLTEVLVSEARAASELNHAGVARVFDVGEIRPGEPFVVMELLDGETLRDTLEREKRLPAAYAVQLLLPVVDAMRAAHARGIVHRDLKPENVVIARDSCGRLCPKVVDFGLAKRIWDETSMHSPSDGPVGTPAYMPPEQALVESGVDARADVWALCTMLYEIIAGYTPFAGVTFASILKQIVHADPAVLGDPHGVDEVLWRILETGLRKERLERWTSAAQLGAALASWLLARGIAEDVSGSSLVVHWPGAVRMPHEQPPPEPTTTEIAWPLVRRRDLGDNEPGPSSSRGSSEPDAVAADISIPMHYGPGGGLVVLGIAAALGALLLWRPPAVTAWFESRFFEPERVAQGSLQLSPPTRAAAAATHALSAAQPVSAAPDAGAASTAAPASNVQIPPPKRAPRMQAAKPKPSAQAPSSSAEDVDAAHDAMLDPYDASADAADGSGIP